MSEYYIESANHELGKYGIEFFSVHPESIGTVTAPHIHSSLEFIYVKRGTFEVTVDNRCRMTVQPESMLVFRANTIHTIVHMNGYDSLYYVLKVAPSLLFQNFGGDLQSKYLLPFLQKRADDVVCISETEIPLSVKNVWNDMIVEERQNELFYVAERINASRLLLALVRSVLCPQSSSCLQDISERTITQIYDTVNYINDNFAYDITPVECAERIHISYGYFAKLFRNVMGKTFKEYLLDVRMSHAHTMLLASDISVTEIALACGYSNLSYFVAEYRRVFGQTPKTTRKESKRLLST